MHGLAHQGAAPVVPPHPIGRRVGTGMCFLAVHPENLGAGFLDDLPLFLDRWGVNPVLRVEDRALGCLLRRQHPANAGKRPFLSLFHRGFAGVETLVTIAEIARKRLLDDHMLVLLERPDSDLFVGDRRRQRVHDVGDVEQVVERGERPARHGPRQRLWLGFRRWYGRRQTPVPRLGPGLDRPYGSLLRSRPPQIRPESLAWPWSCSPEAD